MISNWIAPPSICSNTERTRSPNANTPLQRISMEISRLCNLNCIYCYAEASSSCSTGLTDDELHYIICEAVSLGACLVSFVSGGEPLLRESLLKDKRSCIDHANSLGCYTLLYTNGSLINNEAAKWLASRDVSVVSKLNSFRESIQDELTGVSGSACAIRLGIDALINAGLNAGQPSRLGLETIVCRQNYEEIPEIWRFMRKNNIIPEVEIPTLHGRAALNKEKLCFKDDEAPKKFKNLFEELLRIDREEFGFDWIPHPPFPAGSCCLFRTNCYINDSGSVQPCAGVDISYGFLPVGNHCHDGRPLEKIVCSKEFQKLRCIEKYLEPPCRDCDLLDHCYGCRGAALHQRGSVFAGDPICWRRS